MSSGESLPALSPELLSRVKQAHKKERLYQPRPEIAQALASKALVMVVGPSSIGKSHIMDQAVRTDRHFKRVPVFTSRQPRPDDEPGMFRYIEHNDDNIAQLLSSIDRREVVQYAIHPTTGAIYGTEATDYPGDYNLLATLSGAVDHLRQLPFSATSTIGLVTSPETWRSWFLERYPQPSLERDKRLEEAIDSTQFLLNDERTDWVVNHEGLVEMNAQRLIDVVMGIQPSDPAGPDYAAQTQEAAREMLKQLRYTGNPDD